MKNTLRVTILFSYRGVNYQPSAVIDFDTYLQGNNTVPEFYQIVARENNIDRYTYEFEVMEMGIHQYTEATGLAEKFCNKDSFELVGFTEAWKQQVVLKRLSEIAQQQLAIDDLDQHQGISDALMQAYQFGLDQKK